MVPKVSQNASLFEDVTFRLMPGRRVAIAGVGYSTIGRHTGLSSDELVSQSTQAALKDAGLGVADVDGLVSVGSNTIENAWMLGIAPLRWWNSAAEAPAFVSAQADARKYFAEKVDYDLLPPASTMVFSLPMVPPSRPCVLSKFVSMPPRNLFWSVTSSASQVKGSGLSRPR